MAFQGDSIFWVDTEKVVPNPFQPRREFDQSKLQELSESIRMYGVLQPLTVTRSEVQRDDGTFYTEYELIAGERRLRASRLASIAQVPVIIREGEQNEQEKLELAIIENLQREDLNAIDRALAFQQLAEQFGLSHSQVASKVQRSREYVSNSIRLLGLPEHIQLALQRGELGEGHARTLLMLTDRPEEQEVIFREILLKKMSVREVERIVRKIATDKVRKRSHEDIGEHLIEIEKEFTETLGTRVQIQKTDFGGKLTIDYFSEDDLSALLKRMQVEAAAAPLATAGAALAAVSAATPLQVAEKTVPTAVAQASQDEDVTPTPTPTYQPPASVAPVPSPTITDTPTPQEPSVAQPVTQPVAPAAPEPILSEATAPVHTPTVAPPPPPPAAMPVETSTHTAFGFSRPAHAHQLAAAPVPPVAPAQPIHVPAAPQVETQSHPHPPAAQPTPAPTVPDTHSPQTSPDDAEDMYSVRNFSI